MHGLFSFFTSALPQTILTIGVVLILTVITTFINNRITFKRLNTANAIITSVLDHSIVTISGKNNYRIRANIFMPLRNNQNSLKMRFNSSNAESSPENNLIFEKWQGCTGRAWGYKSPVLGDLTLIKAKNGSEWGLTNEQKELTRNLATILSYPIRHPKDKSKVVGILNFDSEQPIAEHLSDQNIQETVSLIAAEIALILFAFDVI